MADYQRVPLRIINAQRCKIIVKKLANVLIFSYLCIDKEIRNNLKFKSNDTD